MNTDYATRFENMMQRRDPLGIEPRDGDGDGRVYDNTPREQPAVKRDGGRKPIYLMKQEEFIAKEREKELKKLHKERKQKIEDLSEIADRDRLTMDDLDTLDKCGINTALIRDAKKHFDDMYKDAIADLERMTGKRPDERIDDAAIRIGPRVDELWMHLMKDYQLKDKQCDVEGLMKYAQGEVFKSLQDEIEFKRGSIGERITRITKNESYNWLGSITAKHEQAVKKALNDGKDVPLEILDAYQYSGWMPKDKKDLFTIRSYLLNAADDMKPFLQKNEDFEYVNSILPKVSDVRKAIDLIGAERDKEAEYLAGEMARWNKAIETEREAFEKEWGDKQELLYLPATDPRRQAYQAAFDKFTDAVSNSAEAVRKFDLVFERYCQAAWKVLAPAGRTTKFSVVGRSSANIDKALSFLNQVVSADAHGESISVEAKDLPEGQNRAFHTSGLITIRPNERAATVVHEIGHELESKSDLGQYSKVFVANRADGGPKSFGEGFEKHEVFFPDKLYSDYSSKWYPQSASEVISVGLEQLFENPFYFAKKSPDHFDYVVAVLRGEIESPIKKVVREMELV